MPDGHVHDVDVPKTLCVFAGGVYPRYCQFVESSDGSVVPAPAILRRYASNDAGDQTTAPIAYVVPVTHFDASTKATAVFAAPTASAAAETAVADAAVADTSFAITVASKEFSSASRNGRSAAHASASAEKVVGRDCDGAGGLDPIGII
jgi:hypothetical protein